MSEFTVNVVCKNCGETFVYDVKTYAALGFNNMPKTCPPCKDELQGRPDFAKVQNRTPIAEFACVAFHLPKDWFVPYSATDNDKPILRSTVKGNMIGHSWVGRSWSGRLDIFCLATEVPDVVRVRIMNVEHAAGITRTERCGQIMQGTSSRREVTYNSFYEYMVIEPTFEEPTQALVLASVNHKRTLKGFGLQWGCSLDRSAALWSVGFSNSARSGRFGNVGCIAVVDNEHQVLASETGKYAKNWIYNFSHPKGLVEKVGSAYTTSLANAG